MTLEEIELGQEVICTHLKEDDSYIKDLFEDKQLHAFRGVGHIGKVHGVMPLYELAYVSHIEFDETGLYLEYLTIYYLEELKLYQPPEAGLRKAIAKTLVQITREQK